MLGIFNRTRKPGRSYTDKPRPKSKKKKSYVSYLRKPDPLPRPKPRPRAKRKASYNRASLPLNEQKTEVIERPKPGTVYEGIDRAIVTARTVTKISTNNETSSHRANKYKLEGNVRIVIEKAYTTQGRDKQ